MSKIVLFIIILVYWIGVFTQSFDHKEWLNSNPDTWIHGLLGMGGTWAIVFDTLKARQKKNEIQR